MPSSSLLPAGKSIIAPRSRIRTHKTLHRPLNSLIQCVFLTLIFHMLIHLRQTFLDQMFTTLSSSEPQGDATCVHEFVNGMGMYLFIYILLANSKCYSGDCGGKGTRWKANPCESTGMVACPMCGRKRMGWLDANGAGCTYHAR